MDQEKQTSQHKGKTAEKNEMRLINKKHPNKQSAPGVKMAEML